MLAPLAWVVASVDVLLAGIHVYWALGGRRGLAGAIPERDGRPVFQPGPFATAVVAFLLLVSSALVLDRAGVVGPHVAPPALRRWGAWGIAAALSARAIGDFRYVGFFKQLRGTRFAELDTCLYSPLALVLGFGTGIVAWGGA